MFDELDNNNLVPSSNAKPLSVLPRPVAATASSQAEDIFAQVNEGGKPEIFKPGPNNAPPPYGTVIPPETGWKSNKMMVFGLLFGGLLVIIAGGYFGLKLAVKGNQGVDTLTGKVTPPKETNNTDIKPEIPKQIIPEVNNTVDQQAQPIVPVVTGTLDSDQDGLTNEEEAGLGTNPDNSDTDQDGLTDREEVKVYGTDPLNSDTDGDSYKDGDEVKNGYNPKGTGKLLEINKTIN